VKKYNLVEEKHIGDSAEVKEFINSELVHEKKDRSGRWMFLDKNPYSKFQFRFFEKRGAKTT